jgi:peptidoglycan/LPS O-acetylase OafA/YrhL
MIARRSLTLLMAGIVGGVLFAVVWLLVYEAVFAFIFGPVDNPNELYLLLMVCSWPAAFVYGTIFGPLLAVIFRGRRAGLDRRALAAALLVFVGAMMVILASVSWIEFFYYAPLFLTSPLIALLFSCAAYRLLRFRQRG